MNYCSQCGQPVSLKIPVDDNRERFVCDHCGHVHYQNPNNVCGAILTRGDQILLCRRAIEPRHGYWTLPAGFMENNETVAEAAAREGLPLVASGVYGCSNGPRLESAAEIERMRRDGCSMVGMTAMPEAALARELEIEYAGIALVVNWAAGIEDGEISMDEILACLDEGMERIRALLLRVAQKAGQ